MTSRDSIDSSSKRSESDAPSVETPSAAPKLHPVPSLALLGGRTERSFSSAAGPTSSVLSNNSIAENELLAPENFAVVEGGVYRSSFPRSKNIPFLRRLRLKAVISLVPEDYPQGMLEFYHTQGTRLLAHGLEGNKWPFKGIDFGRLQYVMRDILDPNNRPLLIHCNKGKHRTGSVVGCLRKIRHWALSAIFAEYLLYASPKTRLEDQMLIESFEFDPLFRLAPEEEAALMKEMKKKGKVKKEDDEEEDEEEENGEEKKKKKKDKEKKEKDKDKEKTKEKEVKEGDEANNNVDSTAKS